MTLKRLKQVQDMLQKNNSRGKPITVTEIYQNKVTVTVETIINS